MTGAGRLEFYGGHGFSDGIDVTGTTGTTCSTATPPATSCAAGRGRYLHPDGIRRYRHHHQRRLDNDTFRFDVSGGTDARITGFNGAGTQSGDFLYFEDMMYGRSLTASVVESAGRTCFTIQANGGEFGPTVVTVDKIGLVEGIDYFLA